MVWSPPRRDDDMHATDLQHRLGVLARRQVAHDAAHGQRLARDRIQLAAQRHLDFCADARRQHGLDGRRIGDGGDDRRRNVVRQQGGQGHIRVTRAACRGIVARIADEDARFRRGQRPVDALVDGTGRHAKLELVARVPVALGDLLRFACQHGAVGARGDDRGARARLVRPDIAHQQRDVEQPRRAVALGQRGVEAVTRRPFGARLLAGQHNRDGNPDALGTDVVVETVEQHAQRLLARLDDIHVRRGAVGGEHVERGGLALRNVAVQIKAGGEQALRPDDLTHRDDPVALGVVHTAHIHRAMKVEIDAVPRSVGAQQIEILAFHCGVRFRLHGTTGQRTGIEQRHELGPARVVCEEGIAVEKLGAAADGEVAQPAGQRRESAAFDGDAAKGDAHGGSPVRGFSSPQRMGGAPSYSTTTRHLSVWPSTRLTAGR